MNETLPDQTVQSSEDALRNEKSLSNRILGYSFLASVIVNIGWIAWVSNSNIFGSASHLIPQKETKIKVFHPIPQKPKPKPPKPLPPPPPPKQHPHVKPPPPLHIARPPRPQPPRPQPVRQTIQVARTTRSTPNQISLPAVPDTPPPTKPFVPTYTPQPAPPKEQPPVPESPPTPPAPVEQPKPVVEQPKPVVEQPKPVVEHKEPEHKAGWVPIDTQDASALGEYASPEISEDDGVAGKTVTVTWNVNEKGRATNIHVTQRSGNSEVDRKCEAIIRNMRFQPAVQDHYFQEAHMSHDFGF